MARLTVFNAVSLDGYFTGENGDLSWAHLKDREDPEWKAFVEENAKGGGVLVFGRVTYEMMTKYWPTPEARKNDPVVADRMNALPKVVFSKSLDKAEWNNTKLVKGDPAAEMRKMKQGPGQDMVIMGSGTIIPQLASEGLIDEYQLVVNPVVLGKGRTMFEGVKQHLNLRPTRIRTFKNGNVLECYIPAVATAGATEPARRESTKGEPVPTR